MLEKKSKKGLTGGPEFGILYKLACGREPERPGRGDPEPGKPKGILSPGESEPNLENDTEKKRARKETKGKGARKGARNRRKTAKIPKSERHPRGC